MMARRRASSRTVPPACPLTTTVPRWTPRLMYSSSTYIRTTLVICCLLYRHWLDNEKSSRRSDRQPSCDGRHPHPNACCCCCCCCWLSWCCIPPDVSLTENYQHSASSRRLVQWRGICRHFHKYMLPRWPSHFTIKIDQNTLAKHPPECKTWMKTQQW